LILVSGNVYYLKGYGEANYTKELGQRFIAEYSLQSNHTPSQYQTARTLVRRLDEILENKMFTPCFRDTKWQCPPRFTDYRDKYLEDMRKRGLRETTIRSRELYVGRLFSRLPNTIGTLGELTAADLYRVFTQYEWPSTSFVMFKSLLIFLFESGVTKEDLSLCVPKPNRPKSLPSVYSGDEIEKLLSSVDRTVSIGKRDYAVLIIASHMGLRSSDIMNLSLTDINYEAGTIDIVQVKTSYPITLVMNDEVSEAIVDYIKNGRPQSSSDKIFLGTQAPYAPLTAASGHAIAHRYFSRAGISAQG
jgi:site-specific recombinase XerD